MTSRIDRYAVFFSQIDHNCDAPGAVSQHRLFEIFGAEGLRRGFLAVSFLCDRLGLEWDASLLEDMIETRRIDQQALEWRGKLWAAGLQRYVDELDQRGPPQLKRKTVRMYQTAAGSLLEMAKVDSLGALNQAHLDRYLKRHPGQSANLSPFVRHLREKSGLALELKKKAGTPLAKKDRELVLRVRSLTIRLEAETDERRARALLVILLADLYQVPVKDILALSTSDVATKRGSVMLWPGVRDVQVKGRLADLFSRLVHLPQGDGPCLLFAGRNGVQPLSYDAVRYHFQASDRADSASTNSHESAEET